LHNVEERAGKAGNEVKRERTKKSKQTKARNARKDVRLEMR
jgi:hypothetical protein